MPSDDLDAMAMMHGAPCAAMLERPRLKVAVGTWPNRFREDEEDRDG
jgi:hypothetical protein